MLPDLDANLLKNNYLMNEMSYCVFDGFKNSMSIFVKAEVSPLKHKEMKRTLQKLFSASLIALGVISMQEQMSASQQNGETIIIVQCPPTSEGPRTQVPNPFVAVLMNGGTNVCLSATSPCGTVSGSITSTAGDNYTTYFDTSDGSILLPISGNTGYYLLSITMADGIQFKGEFTVGY